MMDNPIFLGHDEEGRPVELNGIKLFTAAQMREAFIQGAYWGMDNPFGPDTDIPQSEALRRWPEMK